MLHQHHPPALRHVCQESRQHATYQKAFFTTLPGESEAQYIWINFQEDMIWLADHKVERSAPHEADIRRLRLTVPNGYFGGVFYEYFFHHRGEIMRRFTALRELHLAIGEDFLIWGTTAGGLGYECPSENVRFFDLQTGLLLTGPQLEMAPYNGYVEGGGRVQDMDDFDEESQFVLTIIRTPVIGACRDRLGGVTTYTFFPASNVHGARVRGFELVLGKCADSARTGVEKCCELPDPDDALLLQTLESAGGEGEGVQLQPAAAREHVSSHVFGRVT